MKFKKTLTRIIFLFPFFLPCLAVMAQEGGQRIQINQGGRVLGTFDKSGGNASVTNPGPLSFLSLDGVPATVANAPCVGETDQACGWYKGFWLFGDGNYLKFNDDPRTMDAASRNIQSYDYGRNGTYNPSVYLTEKYSNDDPPEAARATIINNQAAPTGIIPEPTKRLSNKPLQKIDIDYNHPPRVKYPINFVLSYRQAESASNVLFYYNALQNGTEFSTVAQSNLMTYRASETTAYQTSAYGPQSTLDLSATGTLPTTGAPIAPFTGTILEPLNQKFKSLLNYNVSSPIGPMTEGLTELRVFPLLAVNKMEELPGGVIPASPAMFLAVLIGPDSLQANDEARGKLISLARQMLGPNLPTNLRLNANSNLFIRDIQILSMSLQRSHDPNSLIVTGINDLGNGKFRVSFQMVICNEGTTAETLPSITFNDLTSGNFAGKPNLAAISGVTPAWTGGSGSSWKVTLAGFEINGTPTVYKPSCRSLNFTMETDSAGVQRLYQDDPRALEVCVEFSAGAGECSSNEPLPPGSYQDTNGRYSPAGGGCADCDWWVWLLLALAVLGVVIRLIRGRS